MAVLTQKYPEQIPDLLGYQFLIIEAHQEYEGDNWLAYDRRFRLSAAANHNTVWGHIEQTLWSLAFFGKAKASRCKLETGKLYYIDTQQDGTFLNRVVLKKNETERVF